VTTEAGDTAPVSTPAPTMRRTGRWVRIADRASGAVITAGGLAVIAAMIGICLFLFQTAAPLLDVGRITEPDSISPEADLEPAPVARFAAWPGRVVLAMPDGTVRARAITAGGAPADGPRLTGEPATAWAFDPVGRVIAAGTGAGAISVAKLETAWRPVSVEAADAVAPGLGLDEWTLLGGETSEVFRDRAGVRDPLGPGAALVHSRDDEYRLWDIRLVDRTEVAAGGGGGGVTSVSVAAVRRGGTWLAVRRGDGSLSAIHLRPARGLNATRGDMEVQRFAIEAPTPPAPPRWLLMQAGGRGVIGVWEQGRVARWTPGQRGEPWRVTTESNALTAGAAITAASMSVGSETLLLGDERGTVHVVGTVGRGAEAELVAKRRFDVGDAAITDITRRSRDRTIALGFADGGGALVNTTSGKLVARTDGGIDGRVRTATASGPLDQLLLVGDEGAGMVFGVEPGHPEASLRSLMGRIHYEGYDGPKFVYQSTAPPGEEPKLSLVPLIFGTLKGTLAAMLFAAPLGVLAALYTSEFLHPGVRRIVKPTLEVMASLPSVVLGFLAVVLVSPLLRDHLTAALLSLAVMPAMVILLAGVWRFVPRPAARRVGTALRLLIAVVALALGGLAAAALAGPFNARAFDVGGATSIGGLRGWLDAGTGSAIPGWFLLMAPLGLVAAIVLDARLFGGFWRRVGSAAGVRGGLFGVARAGGVIAVGGLAGLGMAAALGGAGFDPRASVFGPFSQLNTLVVAIVMGFAVIPIVYTISEDAMQSVPPSLRSASLASGATPWQTAIKVVLPVAGPGVFSACMIGLGRAVGETMIVLMATGNAPEISVNIFGGFRTLSANIAVELPEAPRGGTLYRVLFLCGLVLFVMTLVINTTAELVRQRYRKRSAGL